MFNMFIFMTRPLARDSEVRVILKYFLELTRAFERKSLLNRHSLLHLLRKVYWCPSICSKCPTRHCTDRAVGYQTDSIRCKLCLTGAGHISQSSPTQIASRSTDSLLLLQFTAAFPSFRSQLTLLPGSCLPNHSD